MKVSCCVVALLTLLDLCDFSAQAQSSLGPAADKALAEGKDATLNVGFARALGLRAEQPLPLRRIHSEKDGVTNVLNVLRDSTNTIILSERRQLLATFYRSGTLKKAIVNDGAIANGGLTNLSLNAAADGFQKQKKLWLQQRAH